MRRIVVVPEDATSRVGPLLRVAGWAAAPTPDERDDVEAAVSVVRAGDLALYVPRDAAPPSGLRRILVVHQGTRGDRAGMDAADEAALATGAEIVVLHVPPSSASTTSASLPFRMADHGMYDWAEWRDEFLRRFCRSSAGVRVTLRYSAGPPGLLEQVEAETPDLVIVSGPWDVETGTSDVIEEILGGRTPVLIVPSIGQERSERTAAGLRRRT